MGNDKEIMEKVKSLKTSRSTCIRGLNCIEEEDKETVITVENSVEKAEGVRNKLKYIL